MANNQNFIVKHGLTVGGNQYVIDSSGNWLGPDTPYANASFGVANVKAHIWTQDTAPATANINDVWIDSANGIQYTYIQDINSTQWVEFGPIGSPTGNITFSDQTITGSVTNRDITIFQQGTGNIILQSANTIITGNLFANASGKRAEFNDVSAVYFRVNTATTVANSAAVNIVASTGYYTQPPTSNGYMLQLTGFDNSTSRVVNDSASSTGTAYSAFIGRHARGTHQSPSASQSGDMLARFSGNGYGSSGYGVNSGGASVDIYATENYTDTNKGSRLVISTTANGANTRTESASIDANTAEFTGYLKPGKGFVFNPRTITGNSTSIVINFATDSSIRATINADCSFTFTNYVVGKVVEVWITNLASGVRTVTHGCSSTNSTNNNANQNIPATSTTYFKFFSYDGDVANTFVAIVQG